MKTIGLIGGMSWESSAAYYRLINQETNRRLGGQHNARTIMLTVDFGEIEHLMHTGDWDTVATLMASAAQQLHRAGADAIVLCTNTIHKVADAITGAVPIPFLHIVDAIAAGMNHKRAGLLGTRFTMEEPFYRERLRLHGIEAVIPSADSREQIHRIIFDELCLGIIRPESRAIYQRVIGELASEGAECVILGCTEIGLLIQPADSPIAVFDSTALHAKAAVDFALS